MDFIPHPRHIINYYSYTKCITVSTNPLSMFVLYGTVVTKWTSCSGSSMCSLNWRNPSFSFHRNASHISDLILAASTTSARIARAAEMSSSNPEM